MAPRLTIGLTGEVGSGKSKVLAWLAARGVSVLDADEVVRELLEGDSELGSAIIARFGTEVVGRQGIDRKRLAAIVFGDAAALADLEALVHPRVLARIRDWLAGLSSPIAAVEAIKLVESGFHRELDQLWLVTCPAAVRRARLLARGWSEMEVERRMAASPPLAPQLAAADVVIDNSGDWSCTERQLEAALTSVWHTKLPGVYW